MSSLTTITYIQAAEGCPAFSVDFKDFTKRGRTSSNKIAMIVIPIFRTLKCFVIAFKEASGMTFRQLGISFRCIVLNYDARAGVWVPFTVAFAVFKLTIWVADVARSLVSNTARLFQRKWS